ncbi:putative transporter [Frankliniella fusca]|uniref:Transporter n=1 Tax=Frankliniella fusca TaxID=407009 RepID=A0AAE1LD42_9NEOP|nr:putative transporter [Frankliniella fusca]
MLAGPYSIIVERVDACPEGTTDIPFPIDFHLTRDRLNPSVWFVAANLTSYATLNDDREGQLVFASWGARGGWKENALTMKFKRPCTQMKQLIPQVWNNVWAVTTSSTGATDCPLPPCEGKQAVLITCEIKTYPCFQGVYTINNVSSESLQPPKAVPVFFYGKWRVDVRVRETKENKIYACMRGLLQTVPKTAPKHVQ